MREIKKEPDWKVLRRVHPLALERFCERIPAEIDPSRTMARRVTLRAWNNHPMTPYISC